MPKIATPALVLAAFLAGPRSAGAQSGETAEVGILDRLAGFTSDDSISIGGVGFFRYWYRAEGEDEGENTFQLWRLYFNVKARMTSWLSMRFTPDVGPESEVTSGPATPTGDPPGDVPEHTHPVSGDGGYTVFVKYAWFDAKLPAGLSIRAGVIDTPWLGHIYDFWGYRYVSTAAAHYERLLDTADVGAHLAWKMPAEAGEAIVALLNGAGFRRALDGDTYKTLQARLTFTPFATLVEALASFEVGGFVSYPIGEEDPVIVAAGFAGFRHPWFRIAYEIDWRNRDPGHGDAEALGHSAYLAVETPWAVGALARFVYWDPSAGAADDDATAWDDEKLELQAGLSYRPVPFLGIAASDWVTWYRGNAATENTAFLSTEFLF